MKKCYKLLNMWVCLCALIVVPALVSMESDCRALSQGFADSAQAQARIHDLESLVAQLRENLQLKDFYIQALSDEQKANTEIIGTLRKENDALRISLNNMSLSASMTHSCRNDLMKNEHKDERMLCDIFNFQNPTSELLLGVLTDRDLCRLSLISNTIHKVLKQQILQRKLYKTQISNALSVDFSGNRINSTDNEKFKSTVLESLVQRIKANPGKWIKLGMRWNNLGNDVVFLSALMREIKKNIQQSGSDIVALTLDGNNLSALPDGLFEGLCHLQELNLYENKLKVLQPDILKPLKFLKSINLCENKLETLPNTIFNGLSQLTTIDLSRNDLTALPSGIVEHLSGLQVLNFFRNPLSEAQRLALRLPSKVDLYC